MRTLPDDVAPDDASRARRRGTHQPERRCVLTGEVAPAARLVRLALGPDGLLLPDPLARAPGRGAWIAADRAALERALATGKLRGALARAFRTGDFTIPADLADRVARALERVTLERLGLEARGGFLLTGTDRIEAAARRGGVALLLHARDAAPDGRRKLAQAWRVGSGREGGGEEGVILPVDRAALSVALGRENAVHLALADDRAAARVTALLGRWRFYLGCSRDAPGARAADPAAADPRSRGDDDGDVKDKWVFDE